jgi:hypothetical protein
MVNKKISSGLRFAFEKNYPGPFGVIVVKSTGREILLNLTRSQIEELSKNPDITLITTYLNIEIYEIVKKVALLGHLFLMWPDHL